MLLMATNGDLATKRLFVGRIISLTIQAEVRCQYQRTLYRRSERRYMDISR